MRKHIQTVNKAMLKKTLRTGGCGECPASCQSAWKLLAPLATKFVNIANNSKQNKSLDYGRGIFVFLGLFGVPSWCASEHSFSKIFLMLRRFLALAISPVLLCFKYEQTANKEEICNNVKAIMWKICKIMRSKGIGTEYHQSLSIRYFEV